MDRAKEVNEWCQLAEIDFNSAVFLKDMKPKPLEVICFHCQQAAEKYIKAFLTKNGVVFIKTHNLEVLIKECIVIDSEFIKIKKNGIRLTDYAVEVRYPYRFELDDKLMELAISDALVIKEFICQKLQI